MRRKAFGHIQKLSFRFFDNQKTGHLVGRVTKDLEDIGEVAHHGPEELFVAVMTLIGAFAVMFSIEPKLAMIAATIVPLAGIVTIVFGARMATTWGEIFAKIGDFNARIENNISGMRVVQAFTNEDFEQQLFARNNAAYRTTKLQAYKALTASMTLNYLTMRLTQLIVLVAGSWFVLHQDLSNGEFVSFLLLVNVFFQPIEMIGSVIEMYPKGFAGFKRYQELLAIEPEIVDAPHARTISNVHGDIHFNNVSFGYTSDRLVLKDLHLDIKAGETVAVVGASGAGKTTIASLIPRFYDVLSGQITIDGIDIRDMTVGSLRQAIGMVQQDVFLFGGSIRDNIAYGRLGASDEEIFEAARQAKLDEVLGALPEGMDTIVGERGVKLSGGQKQRLAIARIFLKNPPILILDEATSALDTETEREIQAELQELAVGRTTLIIAHRLATVQHADRIVVMDKSGIVEEGRHDDLVQQDGAYRRLYNAQHRAGRRAVTT
jgi:ATP-binding cassette subfamily B protein